MKVKQAMSSNQYTPKNSLSEIKLFPIFVYPCGTPRAFRAILTMPLGNLGPNLSERGIDATRAQLLELAASAKAAADMIDELTVRPLTSSQMSDAA